jgi:hypothetical protein
MIIYIADNNIYNNYFTVFAFDEYSNDVVHLGHVEAIGVRNVVMCVPKGLPSRDLTNTKSRKLSWPMVVSYPSRWGNNN